MDLPKLKPRVVCADGTSLSVQADRYKYCSPRNDAGPHWEVEVGYIFDSSNNPMSPPETWKEYAEGKFPSNVYGYVPVGLVEAFIEAHGGRKQA